LSESRWTIRPKFDFLCVRFSPLPEVGYLLFLQVSPCRPLKPFFIDKLFESIIAQRFQAIEFLLCETVCEILKDRTTFPKCRTANSDCLSRFASSSILVLLSQREKTFDNYLGAACPSRRTEILGSRLPAVEKEIQRIENSGLTGIISSNENRQVGDVNRKILVASEPVDVQFCQAHLCCPSR